MSASNVASRRNIVLIGHGGVGKTALAERILFTFGATTRIGVTTEGSSHLDFEPEEVKRGSTLKTAVFDFSNKSFSHTIIDTPGSSSFIVDTMCALRAADVAVLVVGAVSGLKVQGEKAWNLAVNEGTARAVFINELDKERASVTTALEAAKNALGLTPVMLQLPIGSEHDLKGVVDLITMKAYLTGGDGKTSTGAIPDEVKSEAEEAHTALVESIAETDDALVEKYLEGQELSEDELFSALKSAIARGDMVPGFCGSAETGVGTVALVDAIDNFFPSPVERTAYKCVGDDGEEADVSPDPNGPFAGVVFKTFADPFTGQVSLVRVVTGTLKSDDTVHNPNAGTDERVGKLHVQLGKEQKAVSAVGPGEIVAIVKLKDTRTGHTLCSSAKPTQLVGFEFPESAINYAIEPKSKGDEDKIVSAVEKMALEDPGLCFRRDASTSEMLISGAGQNHIEIALQRIQRKFKVEVLLKEPQVPYRETITRTAEAQGKHKKQSGGRGQYGDCWLRIKPRARGEGFAFNNEIFGGSIPRNYIPAVEKGVVETMAGGIIAGYQMVDVECSVYDGSYHSVDSSDMAFKIAAAKGFRAAVEKAGPVLLEPVMVAEISAPEDTTGDVIGDLNSRRGKVLNMEAKGQTQIIRAEVPLAEMLTYAPNLRSMTADRGSFHLEFHSYEQVPAHIADKLIEELKKKKEEAEGS